MKLYRHFPSEILSDWLLDWQVFNMRRLTLHLDRLPLEVQDSIDYVLSSMQHIIDGKNAPEIFDKLEILRTAKANGDESNLLELKFCYDLANSANKILQKYAKWFNLHYPKMQILIPGKPGFLRWQETPDEVIYEELTNFSGFMEWQTLPEILDQLKWFGFTYKLKSDRIIVKIPKHFSDAENSECHIHWSCFKNLKPFTLFERIRMKLGV